MENSKLLFVCFESTISEIFQYQADKNNLAPSAGYTSFVCFIVVYLHNFPLYYRNFIAEER